MLCAGKTLGNMVTCQEWESKNKRKDKRPHERVKRGKEILRQNVGHMSWLLQIICDKILKERDQKVTG